MSRAALVIFLLLCIPLASAQVLTSSFDSWVITQDVGCQCGLVDGKIFIFNTGKSDTFQLSVLGEASSWVSIAQPTIFVESGDTISVPFFVNIPCDGKAAQLEFLINALGGDEQRVSRDLLTLSCENILVGAINLTQTIQPCETAQFKFALQNSGSWSDTFDFTAPDTIFIPHAVTLAPGAQIAISALTTPSCDQYGSFALPITITPRENNLRESFNVRLDILRNYTFSVTAGEFYDESFEPQEAAYSACVDALHRIPVEVVNKGSVNNIYDISLKGNAQISKNSILVPAGESKFFSIFYAPSKEKQEVLFLDVSSRRGDFIKKIALPIESTICFDANIIAPTSYQVQGPIVIGIENEGSRTLKANVLLEGSQFFSIDKSSINENQSQLTLTPIAPAGYEGVEKPKITLIFPDDSHESKVIEAVYGRPFSHVYGLYILLGVVLLALVVLGVSKVKSSKPKKSKAVKKVAKLQKNVQKETKKSKGFFFGVALVIILVLLILAFIPIKPLTKSPSSSELVFGVDRALRLNIPSFIQGENVTVSSELNTRIIGDALYVSASTPTQSSVVMSSSDESVSIQAVALPLQSRGLDYYLARYATYGYYGRDYVVANWAISSLGIACIFIILIVLLTKKRTLPESSKSNQLSKLEH